MSKHISRSVRWVRKVAGVSVWLFVGIASASAAKIYAVETGLGVFGQVTQPENEFSPGHEPREHKGSARWGFAFENDFFVPGGRDRDYTYGLSLSYADARINNSLWHQPLNRIDNLLGLSSGKNVRYGFEGGVYGFTPGDITVAQADDNDRPYAGLVYFATSKERINLHDKSVLRTQLTLGVLGLDVVGDIQDQTHQLINGDRPQGWDNQISDGGELTFRYAISKQNKFDVSSPYFELRQTKTLSVGYLTEASWGMSFRLGKLNSRWSDFNPELASYAESSSSTARGFSERFAWGGIAIKVRGYNAFLQGQFRDSAVTVDSSDLRNAILEAWGGYTHSFANGVYVSYGLRGHSSEVKTGAANRAVVWGGVLIGRQIY